MVWDLILHCRLREGLRAMAQDRLDRALNTASGYALRLMESIWMSHATAHVLITQFSVLITTLPPPLDLGEADHLYRLSSSSLTDRQLDMLARRIMREDDAVMEWIAKSEVFISAAQSWTDLAKGLLE
jgi:hypothetical protein